MIDARMIPDPGTPRADGYFLQHARAALWAQGIATPEQFTARYGVSLLDLTAFGLLWTVDRVQAERELRLNELYRAGLRKNRARAPDDSAAEGRAA
jgi:hypothetical protein